VRGRAFVVDEEHDGSFKQEEGRATTLATWVSCERTGRVRWPCSDGHAVARDGDVLPAGQADEA
jgi:hypothetical protein